MSIRGIDTQIMITRTTDFLGKPAIFKGIRKYHKSILQIRVKLKVYMTNQEL